MFFIDNSGNSLARDRYDIPGKEILEYECYIYGKRDRLKGLKLYFSNQTISLILPNWIDCEEANAVSIKRLTANGIFILQWESEDSDFIELKKGIWAVNTGNIALSVFGLIFAAAFLLEDRARALAKYWEKYKV